MSSWLIYTARRAIEGTRAMLRDVKQVVGVDKLAVHFHDTYGQALPNILAALEVCV